MNLLDDIPSIVRKSVKHFVVCEAGCTQGPLTRNALGLRQHTIVDNVIEFSVLGDRSVENLLREVVGTDIPANDDGVPSKFSDFLHNKLSFLFIKATETDVSTRWATESR